MYDVVSIKNNKSIYMCIQIYVWTHGTTRDTTQTFFVGVFRFDSKCRLKWDFLSCWDYVALLNIFCFLCSVIFESRSERISTIRVARCECFDLVILESYEWTWTWILRIFQNWVLNFATILFAPLNDSLLTIFCQL